MKSTFTAIFLLIIVSSINAQQFGLGTLLNDSLYANSPTAVPLMRGDYSDLPSSASLLQFAPTPGNQGLYATCAGWSTAYAGRTILEAVGKEWPQSEIDSNAFSPSFVYNQIRRSMGCNEGTSLVDALDVLKEQGGEKLNDFAYDCSKKVTQSDKIKAADYKIIEYREIASSKTEHKERYVRKSLAESRPVVVAFDCPYSFNYVRELWLPDSADYKVWNRGHAMTIVAYDDNKFGGAFQILNSWGTRWGKNGTGWIRYADFNFFCKYAFELIDKSPVGANLPDLSGTLSFKKNNGVPIRTKFNGEYFITDQEYPSGTLFELHISNNEPAYVYAFSSDLTYKTYKIFPFTDRMVAYLPYRNNDVAIPDEDSYNILDTTSGPAYYCFLYSKKELNIDSIMKKIEMEKGTFWERITHVIGNEMVNENDIDYKSEDKIIFKAKSEGKSIVPVLVEIKHI
jgi:Papain family cysteine protease